MSSGDVLLKMPMLLLKAPNVFSVAGTLGSMAPGNGALIYLFIVLSKVTLFCQREIGQHGVAIDAYNI